MASSKGIENVNPQRFTKNSKREVTSEEEDESFEDPIDDREIFGNNIKFLILFRNFLHSYLCL